MTVRCILAAHQKAIHGHPRKARHRLDSSRSSQCSQYVVAKVRTGVRCYEAKDGRTCMVE